MFTLCTLTLNAADAQIGPLWTVDGGTECESPVSAVGSLPSSPSVGTICTVQNSTVCAPTTTGSDTINAYWNGSSWVDLECLDVRRDGNATFQRKSIGSFADGVGISTSNDGVYDVFLGFYSVFGFGGNLLDFNKNVIDSECTSGTCDSNSYDPGSSCTTNSDCQQAFGTRIFSFCSNYRNSTFTNGLCDFSLLNYEGGASKTHIFLDAVDNPNAQCVASACDFNSYTPSKSCSTNADCQYTALKLAGGTQRVEIGGTLVSVDFNDNPLVDVEAVQINSAAAPADPTGDGNITYDTDLWDGGKMATIGDGTDALPLGACSINSTPGLAQINLDATNVFANGEVSGRASTWNGAGRVAPFEYVISDFRCYNSHDLTTSESLTFDLEYVDVSSHYASLTYSSTGHGCTITGGTADTLDEVRCVEAGSYTVAKDRMIRLKITNSGVPSAESRPNCSWLECITSLE